MILNRLKIFFLLQLFVLEVILPQTFPNHHFTVKEGLPNSHILSFTQDEKGFIWLSTPNAVSRFDGHNFTNFFVSDENAVIDKIQIVKGKLIYLINKKGIYSFNRSSFDTIYTEKNTEFIFNKWLQRNDTLFLFSDQSIHLVYNHRLIDSIRINSANSQLKPVSKLLSVFMDVNNRILIGTNRGLFIYDKKKLKRISHDIKFPVYCISEDPESNLWIGSDNKILKIGSDGKIIRQIKISNYKTYPVEKLLIDRFSNIWFSIKNYSLFVLSDGKLIQIGKNLGLDKSQINFITKDSDENIWVGTCYKGLYYFHDTYISNFDEDDVLSNEFDSYLTLHNDKRFADGSSGLLDLFKKNIIRNLNRMQHVFIKEIKKGNDNKIFVACVSDKTGLIDIITSNNNTYYFMGASAIFPDKNNVLITGDWENNLRFYDLSQKGLPIIKKIHVFEKKEKINKIFRDKSDNLWVASVTGLCVIGKTSVKYFKDFELLNCPVNDINIDNNNNTWFASDRGLAEFDGIKWRWYWNYNDYNLRSSSNITFDREGGMWISNSIGLVRFKNKTVNYWDNNSGLIANEIYFLNYDNINNNIWVGTNNGISKFDIDQFNRVEFKPLNIYLEKVSIDDSVLQNQNDIKLNEDNSIRIDFSSTSYENPGNITYQYKFEGLENHWNETENPFVDFTSLSPGNYNLLIRSGTVNKGLSSPLKLSFIIQKPFYKTLYFYSGISLIFILAAVLLTEKRIHYVKKKNKLAKEIENKISALKHQALSAMMNPHFTFNSLTSIQYFINNDEIEKANEYLSKFAKLLRLNLETAENGFITIEEELERLKIYLILEKIRFGHSLTYTIKIDREINVEKIQIPNMLIQPFVENAVWHGILPKHDDGEISIKIEKFNEDNLKITITDNGIGFNKGLELKRSDHISQGMNIIEKRLNLLNESNEKLISVHDVSEYEEDKTGTIVEIILTSKLIRMAE